jgi:hypothetical protein
MNTQRCQPLASLKKLNAAPVLWSRMSSSIGKSLSLSPSSTSHSTMSHFVH